MAGKGVRAYVHEDGRYFTLCPDDGRGDVVLAMPEFHPAADSDFSRLSEAIGRIRALTGQPAFEGDPPSSGASG